MSREATRKWNDTQVTCPVCGITLLRVHRNRHEATNKHADALAIRDAQRSHVWSDADLFFELASDRWLTGVERLLYLWARDGVQV